MINPSLELLSSIFNMEVFASKFDKENKIISLNTGLEISVYELVDKCKKWAWNNRYTLNTIMKKSHITNKLCFKVIIEPTEYAEYSLVGDEEVEAIIAACEWILKQLK